MSRLALRFNVNVIGGSQFVLEGDVLRNASFLFRRDGSIERQDKIHVTPNERRWWGVQPGEHLRRVRHRPRPHRDPGLLRRRVPGAGAHGHGRGRGPDLRAVQHQRSPRLPAGARCAQARAIENQVYVAIAGCAGNLPSVENADIHYSQCGIFTPSDVGFARDAIAAESSPNIETVLTHEVDGELLRRSRHSGTVRPWSDRRTDLYDDPLPRARRQRSAGLSGFRRRGPSGVHGLLATRSGRRLLFAALYFSEGAPIGYVWWALPTRLRDAGVPIEQVTQLSALLTVPWTLKFLWAPLVDSLRPRRFGLRAWIVGAQLAMGLTLIPVARIPIPDGYDLLLWFLLVHALCAATQDVAVDALAVATIPVPERGAMTGFMQLGMLLGRAIFGGVALALERALGGATVMYLLVAAVWSSTALVAFGVHGAAGGGMTSPLRERFGRFGSHPARGAAPAADLDGLRHRLRRRRRNGGDRHRGRSDAGGSWLLEGGDRAVLRPPGRGLHGDGRAGGRPHLGPLPALRIAGRRDLRPGRGGLRRGRSPRRSAPAPARC